MASKNSVPKSRISLTYDTRQPDQPKKEKELPLRLLVVGDLSGRANKPEGPAAPADKPDDLESRPIHNLNRANLDAVMAKMNVSVTLAGVANHVDKEGAPFDVTVPLKSMSDFEPGNMVGLIEPVAKLLEIRKLILDLQGQVDNNKLFRRLVRELAAPANRPLLEQLRAHPAIKDAEKHLRVTPRDDGSPATSNN
jgi:type VI secretion system ImpB/VipA family protein